jgi:hypothetical protein
LASDPKDLDEAEKQLDMAHRLATACDARPLVAFCDTTLSGVHAQRRNHGRAKEFETAATAIYRELSMQPLPLSPLGQCEFDRPERSGPPESSAQVFKT